MSRTWLWIVRLSLAFSVACFVIWLMSGRRSSIPISPWAGVLLGIMPWAITFGIRVRREHRALMRGIDGLCPHCGYDLRASDDQCPECGATFP